MLNFTVSCRVIRVESFLKMHFYLKQVDDQNFIELFQNFKEHTVCSIKVSMITTIPKLGSSFTFIPK